MNSTIYSHYSIDECKNEDEMFGLLDKFAEEGKITYQIEDQYILKIEDLDLSTDEIDELLDLFDSLDVFEYYGHEDEEDDYGSSRGRRNSDDDYDDY